jgi:hypothetical protein
MKHKDQTQTEDLRPEYDFDFSQGERGRYYKRLLQEGSNIVVLEPDLAAAFPDSASVNDALRSLLGFARMSTGLTRPATAPKKARRASSK